MSLIKRIHEQLVPEKMELGMQPYVHLIYLFFFFFSLYFKQPEGTDIVIIAIGLVCFLFCYFRAYWYSGKTLLAYITAICLIAVAMSEINWGGATFFVYAAAFCGALQHRKQAFIILLAIITFVICYTLLTDKPIYFGIASIFMSFIIGIINIYQFEVALKNSALKQSQQEIKILAQTAERERISRDLHDLLGHSLSVITLKSELAGKILKKGGTSKQALTEIKAVEELSRETLAQVRNAVTGYNKATLSAELLQAKVATNAASIELITDLQVDHLPEKMESELALIVREAITNVVRHANTTKVWIKLTEQNSQLNLTVSDEGQGPIDAQNSGINNMKTRIEKLAGTMTISCQPHVKLLFSCPITGEVHD